MEKGKAKKKNIEQSKRLEKTENKVYYHFNILNLQNYGKTKEGVSCCYFAISLRMLDISERCDRSERTHQDKINQREIKQQTFMGKLSHTPKITIPHLILFITSFSKSLVSWMCRSRTMSETVMSIKRQTS